VMLVPPGVWAYECPFCDLGVMIQLFESLTVVVKHGPNPEHVRQMSVETLLALTHEHFCITGPREISDWLVEVHRFEDEKRMVARCASVRTGLGRRR
jgi:hypothetical protein